MRFRLNDASQWQALIKQGDLTTRTQSVDRSTVESAPEFPTCDLPISLNSRTFSDSGGLAHVFSLMVQNNSCSRPMMTDFDATADQKLHVQFANTPTQRSAGFASADEANSRNSSAHWIRKGKVPSTFDRIVNYVSLATFVRGSAEDLRNASHAVRHERRKVCHEEGNADQCPAARRKSNRDC